MTYWRGLAVAALLECAVLAHAYPPPFGWRAQLQSVSGISRVNLMDPAIRFQATHGKQSVDDHGQVIECAGNPHPNCRGGL